MKKLFLFIIVIAGLAFFFLWDSSDTQPAQNEEQTSFQPDPANASFTFDDGPVTLSNGSGEKSSYENSGFFETVELLKEKAVGDLNADGKSDTVVLLARSGGGSGVFIYIAAFVSGPVSYRGTDALFIGDRVSPESVSIANSIATLKYLDRKTNEPFAAEPAVPTTKQFVYKNGEFVER